MRALEPEVVDAVWAAVEPLLPGPGVDEHPLGCHRPRVPDRVCFDGILIRLVTGCAWVDVERLLSNRVSDTTLRDRRDEWIAAGVFEGLAAEAIAGYDRIVGLDLSECAVDASVHQAPTGGEGTGPSPVGPRQTRLEVVAVHGSSRHPGRLDDRGRQPQRLHPARPHPRRRRPAWAAHRLRDAAPRPRLR